MLFRLRSAFRSVISAAALLSCLGSPAGGQPQTPPADQPIRATAQEVVIDVIVREKKGRTVRDLRPDEIEVTEDGVRQTILSLRRVEAGELLEQKEGTAAQSRPLDPMRQVRLVTLAFDRLGVEGRRLSRQAAGDLFKQPREKNVFYSIVWLDPRLRVIQPFTSDRDLLRRAVERITGGASTEFNTENHSLEKLSENQKQNGIAPGTPSPGGPGAAARGAAMAEAAMAQAIARMVSSSDELSRQQRGGSSLLGLMSMVQGLAALDGRKTVLYFSEGLHVPQSVLPMFQETIGQANRFNVSFYAIDARGLDVTNQISAARTGLNAEANRGRAGLENRQATVDTDAAIDSIRRNVQGNLMELAESTGGFLVADSNDLRGPLRKISEDALSYYELSYTPANNNWDGGFRALSVKVSRPNTVIQSRTGYFALPPGMQTDIFPHEVPLLKALATVPPPRQIDYRASAFRFRRSQEVQCSFDIEVPFKNIAVNRDDAKGVYDARISFLVIIKNNEGRPVRKITRDLPVQAPLDKLEAFQQGNFIYSDTFSLPPGRYTMESAVMDRIAEKVGVKRAILALPSMPAGIMLSDLAFIRRVDTSSVPVESDLAADPFRFEGGKIVPQLTASIPAGKDAQLSLYFVVYPSAGTAKPYLTMEFSREGQLIARAQPELPPAGADGRIPYVAVSSIGSFQPGMYDVRVIVRQGETADEQRTSFTVE